MDDLSMLFILHRTNDRSRGLLKIPTLCRSSSWMISPFDICGSSPWYFQVIFVHCLQWCNIIYIGMYTQSHEMVCTKTVLWENPRIICVFYLCTLGKYAYYPRILSFYSLDAYCFTYIVVLVQYIDSTYITRTTINALLFNFLINFSSNHLLCSNIEM